MSPADPPEDGSEGVWVGGGAFRVDRRKALEKLSKYQLADPDRFILCWVRAAVAAEATQLGMTTGKGFLEVRFDGRAFAHRQLADPWAALFEKESYKDAHRRQLAMGLLAVLRLKPATVEISSGRGKARSKLTVRSLESDSIVRVEEADEDTVIRVSCSQGGVRPERSLEHVRSECGMCPFPVLIQGKKIVRITDENPELGLDFSEGKVSGRLLVPEGLPPESRVEFFVLGARADIRDISLSTAQVAGWVNGDELRLDVSQAGVVEDSRLREVENILDVRAGDLALSLGEALKTRLPRTGKLLTKHYRLLCAWKDAMESGASSQAGGLFDLVGAAVGRTLSFIVDKKPQDKDRERIQLDARVLRWLRDICSRLVADPGKGREDAFVRGLRAVPMYISAAGKPLTLAELDSLAERDGRLRCAVTESPLSIDAPKPEEIVWCVSRGELFAVEHIHSLDFVR